MLRAKFGFIGFVGLLCFAAVSAFAASDHVSITQKKMKYGPKGTNTAVANQCWTKIDNREYARCLFPNGVSDSNNGNIIKVEMQSQTMQVAPTLADK